MEKRKSPYIRGYKVTETMHYADHGECDYDDDDDDTQKERVFVSMTVHDTRNN
jgi:hypothetical protein